MATFLLKPRASQGCSNRQAVALDIRNHGQSGRGLGGSTYVVNRATGAGFCEVRHGLKELESVASALMFKAFGTGVVLGAVLFVLIGGVGVAAMGNAVGLGVMSFMLIGGFLGVAGRSIYRDIRRSQVSESSDQTIDFQK